MVTTLSSQELSENMRLGTEAAEQGPVFITRQGVAAHVLLTIQDYRRLAGGGGSIVEQLALPGGTEDVELEIPSRPDLARAADLT